MILVTGTAGFIGFHLAKRLLDRGDSVVGVDNHNAYYDPCLKLARVEQLEVFKNYNHIRLDIADKPKLVEIFRKYNFKTVVNLAAQAGVRYSLENPEEYISSNIVGFANILECCRNHGITHLVYASSSSVYGSNANLPFSESDAVDHPRSLYAATKRSNELMAHSYSHLYDLPTTGLRFFTVYGPWGRPDMALFLFTKAILNGDELTLFNNGEHQRDFTYIDDIVAGIIAAHDEKPDVTSAGLSSNLTPDQSVAPFRVLNIGRGQAVNLRVFISAIERQLGKRAIMRYRGLQPGDVESTLANVQKLELTCGYKPKVSVDEGIEKFVSWYLEFYG